MPMGVVIRVCILPACRASTTCKLLAWLLPDRAKFCEQGYGVLIPVEEIPPPLKQVMKLEMCFKTL